MFYQKNKLPFLLATVMLLPCHLVNANEQQAIDIKAKYLLLDENKGISKYKGNVLFSKGTLTIKADSITLYYKNKNLTKALINGSPADVQHQPDNEDKVHSQANNMEYFVDTERLILKGQAFVDQGNRHFSGEYIEYDTRQRIITAAGSQNNQPNETNSKNEPENDRVHVIIGPTNEPAENNNKIKE